MNTVVYFLIIQRELQQAEKGRFYALLPNKASLLVLKEVGVKIRETKANKM